MEAGAEQNQRPIVGLGRHAAIGFALQKSFAILVCTSAISRTPGDVFQKGDKTLNRAHACER